MSIYKTIRYSLLFPAAYFISVLLYMGKPDEGKEGHFILYLFLGCLVVWALGIFLGVLISAVLQIPSKEPYFYVAAQLLVLLIILSLYGYNVYKEKQHEKKYGNIEYNHSYLLLDWDRRNAVYANPPYIKSAFNQLESEFGNKNDIRLTHFFALNRDSINGSYTDTLHIVYFTYILRDTAEVFSKIQVFENKAETTILNGIIADSEDFMQARGLYFKERQKRDSMIGETLKEFEKSIKEAGKNKN